MSAPSSTGSSSNRSCRRSFHSLSLAELVKMLGQRRIATRLAQTARARPALAPRSRTLTTTSRPSVGSSSPQSHPGQAPKRSLFLLSTALATTGLLAGYGLALAAPRPGLVSLVFPHPTPHPPSADSPEAVEHTDVIEKGLHELEIVKRLKAEVVPSLTPADASSSDAAPSQATSLTNAASQLSPTSALDTPLTPRYTLSRPYAATPPGPHSLSGYTLRGPGKFAVPPLVFTTKDKRESVLVVHVGGGLCGHEGVVHGGLLATVMDEALGRTVRRETRFILLLPV